jgi:hypothetical protein
MQVVCDVLTSRPITHMSRDIPPFGPRWPSMPSFASTDGQAVAFAFALAVAFASNLVRWVTWTKHDVWTRGSLPEKRAPLWEDRTVLSAVAKRVHYSVIQNIGPR